MIRTEYNDYNAITKNGNLYKRTNLGKKIATGVAAAKALKFAYGKKDIYMTIGKKVSENQLKDCKGFGAKSIAATITACKIVPIFITALGIGTIVDGIINKAKAAKADKQ